MSPRPWLLPRSYAGATKQRVGADPSAAPTRFPTGRPKPAWVCWASIVATALALTACGDVHHDLEASDLPGNTTATAAADPPPQSSTAPAITASDLPHRYRFRLTREGGYEFSGVLAVGEPMPIKDAAVTNDNQTFAATAGCDPDLTADAAIPAAVTFGNESGGFASPASVGVRGFRSIDDSSPAVYVGDLLSDQVVCHDPYQSSDLGIFSTGTLDPGESRTALLMFYAKRYFDPDHPNGNPAALHRSPILIGQGLDDQNNVYRLTELHGPGARSAGYIGYQLPLTQSKRTPASDVEYQENHPSPDSTESLPPESCSAGSC
jgi:hypothetical protein